MVFRKASIKSRRKKVVNSRSNWRECTQLKELQCSFIWGSEEMGSSGHDYKRDQAHQCRTDLKGETVLDHVVFWFCRADRQGLATNVTINPSVLLVIKGESDNPLIHHLAVQGTHRDIENARYLSESATVSTASTNLFLVGYIHGATMVAYGLDVLALDTKSPEMV
ncbi:hypothetical protein E5288_WYG014718 [Bos mutus]|uniref:Uncharacterized protein n=1 Tax=Bos mutus TaxID=72004 RepID=A0A6B0R752_9CETA|nr:hypothetical protein [Bos mutus]